MVDNNTLINCQDVTMKFTAIVITFFICFALNSQPIILNTELAAPYQIMSNGVLSGKSVQTVECVLDRLEYDLEVQVVPWKRAMANVRSNRANGFFASMISNDLDSFAEISAPIILEKWYFFSLKSRKDIISQDKENIRIGSIFGSNQYMWLEENGYENIQGVETYDQLFKLLEIERIDAIFADYRTFYDEMEASGYEDNYEHEFCKFTPLGVYFSRIFLNKNPEFMNQFNESISVCSPEESKLTEKERDKIKILINNSISTWINNPDIIEGIKSQNKSHIGISIDDVVELEENWRRELNEINRPLIDRILDNSVSEYLRTIQKQSNGLFTEIFVMDNKGLVAGMCEATTDYWQGDEDKFSKAKSEGVFIDDIEFDSSVKRFQSQINIALRGKNNEFLGVITVGVDLEKALRGIDPS